MVFFTKNCLLRNFFQPNLTKLGYPLGMYLRTNLAKKFWNRTRGSGDMGVQRVRNDSAAWDKKEEKIPLCKAEPPFGTVRSYTNGQPLKAVTELRLFIFFAALMARLILQILQDGWRVVRVQFAKIFGSIRVTNYGPKFAKQPNFCSQIYNSKARTFQFLRLTTHFFKKCFTNIHC